MSSQEPVCTDPLGRALHYADRLLSSIENATNLIAGSLIFGLMLLELLQVVLRMPWIDAPIFGHIDIIEVGMVGFTILSIAYVQRLGGHVRMELVVSALKGRMLWGAEMIGSALTAALVFVLIPGSYAHFERAFEFGDSTMDIELVTWPAKLVVPVALSVLLLRVVLQFVGYTRMLWNPRLTRVGIPIVASSAERAKEEIDMARDLSG